MANTVTPRQFTRQDIDALRARRSQLSDQLTSASGRRDEVREDLRNATGVDKEGLEERLSTLDKRIVRLEQEIDESGQQIASIEASRASTTRPAIGGGGGRNPDRFEENMVPIAIVFTIFVLAPIALSISRWFWKRGSIPKVAPQSAEQAQRIERMEHAIDSIAIEIERVSEGQRFVTRLLSEGQNAGALSVGQRQDERLHVPR